jgi:mono/diheme cytochrome c family protein
MCCLNLPSVAVRLLLLIVSRAVTGVRTGARWRWLALSLTCVACATSAAQAGDRDHQVLLQDLSGVDLSGRLHRFAETQDCRAVAFVFLSLHCPISNTTLPELRRISAAHTNNGVEIYGVISTPGVTRDQAIQHSQEYRIGFPVLFDTSCELRRLLRPSHTPQAVVVSADGSVLYSGRIDNSFAGIGQKRLAAKLHDLSDALSAITAGAAVKVPVTTPVGCPLEDAPDRTAAGTVTFNRDIAPLIFAHCVECHRPGQSAPFPLLTYDDVAAHARQIANVTASRFMPPWHPAEDFGRFRDMRRLSDGEISLIQQWVGSGCPEGVSEHLMQPPRMTNGWQLGRPDLVLQMPQEFELAADGTDLHQHFVLPTALRQHRLVTAVEFHPGNSRVVHHACFYVDDKGLARQRDNQDAGFGYAGGPGPGFNNVNSLRSWLPGMRPRRLPIGYGQLLNARSDVVLEIHYQRSGKVEKDRSTIGIYFAERSARQMVFELQVMNMSLDIPAGAARHLHRASYTLPAAATLLDVAPHMHLLGREMKATATTPDGRIVPLIWIKQWDFNWQGQYSYIDPVRLPVGSRIDVDTWYDNSQSNALNPWNPPQRVRWGEQTKDEMGICHFLYTCDTRDELDRLSKDHQQYRTRQAQDRRKVPSPPTGASP